MWSDVNEAEKLDNEHYNVDASLRYDGDNMKHATHIFIHERSSQKTDWRPVFRRKCDGHDIFVDDNRCASFDYLTL